MFLNYNSFFDEIFLIIATPPDGIPTNFNGNVRSLRAGVKFVITETVRKFVIFNS
jgi:hypothetical protein